MVLKLILIIIYLFFICKLYYYLLNILQQNHYEIGKLNKSLKKYYFKKTYIYIYYIVSVILLIKINLFTMILSIMLLLISFIFQNKYIIKLKFTKRIIRLIITSFIILIIVILINNIIDNKLNLLIPLYLPFILIIVNIINLPIEKLINKYYERLAKKKINIHSNLINIAITGSYGKTSTKDLLYNVLNNKYITLKSPHSYNTIMGLSVTINQMLSKMTEIFISEMGAFRPLEIKQMSNLIKPDIAIITQIGPQHISTFKNINNVLKAKLEIISGLKKDGILILNVDNLYLNEIKDKYSNLYKVFTFGINNGIYNARNIKYINNITKFDIYENNNYIETIETTLLGNHQILNILCIYATLKALFFKGINITNNEFKEVIKKVKPSNHRLSYYHVNNLHIYDDSYSSNIVGSKNAIEVLKKQQGIKAIITPGIVDCGKELNNINLEFSKNLEDGIDLICLIKNKSIIPITKYLDEKQTNYQLFNNFKEAYQYILNYSNEKINLLIENDLPDSFIER